MGILEKNIFKKKKELFKKSLMRILLVLVITLIAYIFQGQMDKFLGLVGALFCGPIAFIYPGLFNYKLEVSKSKLNNFFNLFLIVFGIIMTTFSTLFTLIC